LSRIDFSCAPKHIGFYLIIFGLFVLSSCNDSTIVGSDLFDGQDLKIDNTDTLSIMAKTVRLDSVRTFSLNNNNSTTFLIGELDEPYFGVTRASLIAEAHYSLNLTTGELFVPDYRSTDVLDSMILVLILDASGNYGDSTASHDLEVFRVAEDLRVYDELFSTQTIMTEPTPIASISGVVISADSVDVYNPVLDSIFTEAPQIRIPMGEDISNEFFTDLAGIENDADFVTAFSGIKVESILPSNSVFGVNIDVRSFTSRIVTYYSRGDTSIIYTYPLNDLTRNAPLGRRLTEYDRDLDGAIVTDFSSDEAKDSLLFVETGLGHVVELDFSSLLRLDDVLINRAEIEMVVASLDDFDLGLFPPIQNLIMTALDQDGEIMVLDEVNEGIQFNQLDRSFGGSVEPFMDDGQLMYRYKMNISRSVIQIKSGELLPAITLTPLLNSGRVNRSIIYGPDHPRYPMKLNVGLTVL